jgi:hypothetical protein
MDMEYRYTAGQNNGRIAQSKDWISGEEVTYAYDSLQRLISAQAREPRQSWSGAFTARSVATAPFSQILDLPGQWGATASAGRGTAP